MAVMRVALRDGRRRSPSCSRTRQASPPSAAFLMRRKNLRTLRALRAHLMSSGSPSVRLIVGQRQQRAVVATADNLTTLARLIVERLQTTPASGMDSPPTVADHAATTCSHAASKAPATSNPTWGEPIRSEDVPPETYLLRLLEKRGRQSKKLLSSAEAGYNIPLTEKQIRDYSSKPFISDLVRKDDIVGLEQAVRAGRGMDASNKFGESVVHVACRTGNIDILRFLVANGGSLTCCDDLGRFPLHEVCWAVEPRFDIIRLFLDHQKREQGSGRRRGGLAAVVEGDGDDSPMGDDGVNLLLVTDKRGCTPLRYVKQTSWPQWRAFLDEIVDEYWPSPP